MRPDARSVALVGVLVLATIVAMRPAGAAPETLTIVTWGGAYEAAQREALFEPFTAATGISISTVSYDGGVRPLREHIEAATAPKWDLVDMIETDAARACDRGLLEPFDPAILAPAPDGTPAVRDFIDGSFGECAVSQLVFATVVAYDDRAFPGEKPATIADFFDIERFPGKRGLRRSPAGLLEWALRAYNVPHAQVYDLLSTDRGLKLAFRQLDRIKDQIVWWAGGATPVELLEGGTVTMTSGYNGRFFAAQTQGAPVSVIWDSALVEHSTWVMPKASANRDAAEAFIRFATSSEAMAAMANRIAYGPTRFSAQRRIGLHVPTGIPVRPHLPTTPRHRDQALVVDHAWYSRTADLRQRLFDAWLAAE
jgi:putative spermidine/putrescine transport system substrate-binding protein